MPKDPKFKDLAPQLSLEELMAAAAAKTKAQVEAITNAATIAEALAVLAPMLPKQVHYLEAIAKSPIIAALAAHPDPNATPHMMHVLGELVGGPLAGQATWTTELPYEKRALAFALVHALHRRGGAADAVLSVWIDHPDHLLRNHEGARALGKREIDERLVALLGTTRLLDPESDDQQWCVEALFAIDPASAPARATKLLEGDGRENVGALEGLRSIASHLYDRPELRSPVWEEWLRRIESSQPESTTANDLYDQLRGNAVDLMALWKMPEAIPALQERLTQTTDKVPRKQIEDTIAKLGGAPPQAKEAKVTPKGNVIEASPSGRAACRGCKEKIAKDELRFGMAVTNVFSESGELSMRWYHLRCAAQKTPAIFGPALDAYVGEVPDREMLKRQSAEGAAKKAQRRRD